MTEPERPDPETAQRPAAAQDLLAEMPGETLVEKQADWVASWIASGQRATVARQGMVLRGGM